MCPPSNRRWLLAGLVFGTMAGAAIVARPAPGQELVRESFPERWIEEYAPEKLPELKFPAYYSELDKAREEVFRGRYKAAVIRLPKITDGDPAEVAWVKGKALAAVGRRDEALAVLSEPKLADNLKVQLLRAQVIAETGRLDDAIARMRELVEKHPDSVHARVALAEAAERAGNLELAREHYAWVHRTYYDQWMGQGYRAFEDAELVTLMGRAFDRHATLGGHYAGNAALNRLMLRIFVQAYNVIDREYWPAHVAAAEFFYARSNAREAKKELAAALAANPQDVRALVLMGLISLEEWNFDAADRAIATIRRVERYSVEADLLEARNFLQQRRPKDAEVPLGRVLARQPRNIEALGLLAGAYALQLKEDKVAQTLAEVEKIDPDNATAYLELAEQLGAMRQYPRAEKVFQVAIDRAPWWTAPRNGLGLLLTQSGDEDKAKVVLDAAYHLDPYNHRTTNYLILLDKMAKMERRESANFIVLYDAKTDPLIGEYFNDYLESVHAEICKTFRHTPPVKTLIEVFPGHDAFSVRTTGSPWIGTVGASTGRVIAMVTPRKGDNTMGAYNWAQVLRHEYTHTVTLSATENRIGHWMTEGLAVYEERTPMRWEWVPMLYNAVKKKQLFTMEDLTWAFVRPRRPQDRSLAYAQSYWVCKHIAEKYGHGKLLEMMAAFKSGKTQEDVFIDVLGRDVDTFFTEFTAWTEKEVSTWGYDEETTKKVKELTEKAEQLTKARKDKEALALWKEILALRPMDQLPHQRLAGLYLSREVNEPKKAIEHLIRLHQVSLHKNMFAKAVARMAMRSGDFKTAEKYALESVYVDPYDLLAHELLLECHRKTDNRAGIEREERVIPILKKWHEDFAKSQNPATAQPN